MKLFIHVADDSGPSEWKLTLATVRTRLPDVEISDDTDLSQYGYKTFIETPRPDRNEITQDVIEVLPILINGEWTQQWSIINLGMDIIVQQQTKILTELADLSVNRIQCRLDEFARTKNYDNILSATTYTTSKILSFAKEGQYCADVRDATWAKMYEIYSDVQNGLRAPPTTYEEIEALLPALSWPL